VCKAQTGRLGGSPRLPPRTWTELVTVLGLEQSAVSHQLRLLRNLGLVTGTRHGRNIVYSLYDAHVAQLLDEAIYHSEHLRLGLADDTSATSQAVTSASGVGIPSR
jgi:DNA-binding transcriptional ArsR family regulator